MAAPNADPPASRFLQAVLVCPEKILWQGDAVMVSFPGVEGEAGVRFGHVPLLALLAAGPLTIETPGGEKHRFAIFGGFVETDGKKLLLLVEEAIGLAGMDAQAIATEIGEAKEDLTLGEEAAARGKIALARAETKARVLARFTAQR